MAQLQLRTQGTKICRARCYLVTWTLEAWAWQKPWTLKTLLSK